jgi:mono/diheme cytochrome c family protein
LPFAFCLLPSPRGVLRRKALAFCLLPFAFCLAACRMDMQDQPKYLAYRASTTFPDGMSQRPLVEGTIPRGYLREDKLFYTGKGTGGAQSGQLNTQTGGTTQTVMQTSAPNMQGNPTSGQTPGGDTNIRSNVGGNTGQQQGERRPAGAGGAQEQDATVFPFPVTADVLKRGQERYNIYCSMCHGMTGYGDGMIPRRGFRRPPSYHTDQLRQAPVGHFFDVITNGWGAMPDYATQIPVQDRWAIIAYVRALQLAQTVNKSEVSPEKLSVSVPHGGGSGGREGGGEHH